MNKIWMVFGDLYDKDVIYGFFSTKEKAEIFARKTEELSSLNKETLQICKWSVDEQEPCNIFNQADD